MVIFNSYVKLPEGMLKAKFWGLITDGLIHFFAVLLDQSSDSSKKKEHAALNNQKRSNVRGFGAASLDENSLGPFHPFHLTRWIKHLMSTRYSLKSEEPRGLSRVDNKPVISKNILSIFGFMKKVGGAHLPVSWSWMHMP